MALHSRSSSAAGPDVASAKPDGYGTPRRGAGPNRAPGISSPQALRSLQGSVGNRAAARLLASRRAEAPAQQVPVQRVFTASDLDGKYVDLADIITEARLGIADNLDVIEAADPEDLNGVYGNYLENRGLFARYMTEFYESGGNYGNFDLAQPAELVRLYMNLKKFVMAQVEAGNTGEERAAHPDFTPGQILFASISGGKVGSIYFPNGRIRLAHDRGREIAVNPGVVRFTISNEDYDAHWDTHGSRARIEQLPSCRPAVVGGGGRLVEFWPGKRHPSRGGPEAFNYALTQAQLNIIYRAARSGDNGVLRRAMAVDPLLRTIPMN